MKKSSAIASPNVVKVKKTPHKAIKGALCGVFLKVCSLCCNAVIL
ncbi:hypothetical protein [Ruminococcus callidus]